MRTMRERDDRHPLCGIAEMDDPFVWTEKTLWCRHGRGAERKTPFAAAAKVSADGRPERLRLNPVAGFRKPGLEA